MSNCLLSVFIRISNRHYKINLSKTKLLIFSPKLSMFKIFPISLDDNFLLPVAQDDNFGIILHISVSCPHPVGQRVITAMPSKYIQDPALLLAETLHLFFSPLGRHFSQLSSGLSSSPTSDLYSKLQIFTS